MSALQASYFKHQHHHQQFRDNFCLGELPGLSVFIIIIIIMLDEVDKEVTKVKKLVMEANEDLVLVFIHCDCQRGYHKVVLE